MSTHHTLVADLVKTFKAEGRIVIVGASLAGLRAAEALRDEGFTGSLTLIGDEVHEPYDRPPLSKQVLKGWVPAENTKLPRMRAIDADWRLGVAATGLDRANRASVTRQRRQGALRQVADRDRRPVPAVVQSGRGQAEGAVHAPHQR